MNPNNSNLRAWVHWKKEYLSKNPDEDEQMFVDTIDNLLKENKKLRELWAAIQAYQTSFSDHKSLWENIESILVDLNEGNF